MIIKYKGRKLSFDSVPTPAQIEQAYNRAEAAVLKKHPARDAYPLSLAQQQIWFQEQTVPGTTTYNVPVGLAIDGPLNIPSFYQALDMVVMRHDIFRIRITIVDGTPSLVLTDKVTANCPLIDLSHLSQSRRELACKQRQALIADTVFDFTNGPMMVFELVKLTGEAYQFIAVFHHLITDQHSLQLFVSELFEYYEALLQGKEKALPALPLSYMDFVLWESHRVESGALESEQKALMARFCGELPTLDLLPDYVRQSEPKYDGGFRQLPTGKKLALQIRQLAGQQDCTPYVLALSALAVVLSRYTSQTDLIIGTPFSGRMDAQIQGVMGLFVSMQPIRLDLSGAPTFMQLMAHTTERVLEAENHQNYPLLYLMRDLKVDRQSGRSPLFQTIFTYEAHGHSGKSTHGLELTPMPLIPSSAKFEVSFTFREEQDGATIAADFRTDLFDPKTIESLLQHWLNTLETLSFKPNTNTQTMSLLRADEIKQLTRDPQTNWHNTCPVATVHQLVEHMVEKHPEQIAVVHGEQRFTYLHVNERANKIARWLKKQGIGRGQIVVLFFERGVEAVIAMLAVLKAGGAYLPLAPADPLERLTSIVTDSGATIGLCDKLYCDVARQAGLTTLGSDILASQYATESGLNLSTDVTADDRMNVLYTSGSTGMPKGVVLPHRGILRLVYQPNFIDFSPGEVAMQLCPLNFDGATFEIWGMLANGGTIVVADKNVVLSPRDLAKTIDEENVTTLILTTPLLNRLIEDEPESLSHLRHIVFGGEIVSKPHMNKALQYCQANVLLHTYGPTENSFTSCFYPINTIQSSAWTIPIGQAVSHTEIYILDDRQQPVPLGVVGEIYLSGQGLADGYLNDPEKTTDNFIANPFAYDQFTQKMYRTRDRGRRLRSGMIEFVGRTDNQVKIRSQRVEIGEVEEALRKHQLVAECFVNIINGNDGGKQLVAYFVPIDSSDSGISKIVDMRADIISDIRGSMHRLLPDYMVPTHIVALTSLPLNPNGKVNRRALPAPDMIQKNRAEKAKGNLALTSLPLTTTSFSDVAAVALVESTIEKIWLTVLGIDSVKITDNFFDIGGHSLSLVKVQQAIEKATGILLSIADFFKYTTIEALAIAVSAQMLPSANQQQSQPTAVSEERQTRLADDEMIAIIGMGIRAPLADNVDEYWQNLKAGRDCITRFSEDEVNAKTRAQFVDHGEAWVKAGGLLNDVYGFDNHFFGMSEFEAKQMDPQQRILLECVADALDDGGLGALARKERISLFVGATPSHYGANADASVSGAESLVAEVSSNIAFIATRISHRLNLKGESIMVNTLCSTSLVATHMAVTSLLTGSSDYAIAGGVTIEAPQKVGYLYEPNFIMSPNGQCRTFDKDANGTVPGNGAGVVLMRRLSDALADGDPIHAIVRASAVNNDGHDKVGYYAPSVQGQAEVIKRAHQIAGISADSISYVEAHGTATKMGDPIEVSALTEAFSQSTSAKGFCGIGSVKSNIGHLGDAAGIAGLIKTVLCLKNAYLPASLHYETPNPNIDLANSPFYVIAEGQPWAQGQGPRRAGVSSYGIGGTNAHVILEEAP